MTDVAQAAGVSQSTVSMVLNRVSGARLSAPTRARVLAAAAGLGYRLPRGGAPMDGPGAAAPGAAAHRNLIGYLVDEISASPHPVVSIDGARDAAWAHGCVLQVLVTRNNAEQEADAIAALRAQPALLGIVYSTVFTRGISVPAALDGLPVVLLNCHDASSRCPVVVPAEVAGGHAATDHLIRQGHTRIACINGEPWMEAAQDRLKGYRRALASADLPYDAELVRDGDWMSGTGYEHTLQLMRLAQPPSAIFCANDLMALGALEAVKALGLRVPEDVSVMGYDDQEIARHSHPPLTTLLLPNYEMGQAAVEALTRLVEAAPAAEPARRAITKIDGPLVLRDSVAAPPPRPAKAPSPALPVAMKNAAGGEPRRR
jgi:LacI family transcriptional regulator